ncbi:MAG TPA: hypothetical protein VG348_05775 [Acidimicrobiia bacterium]|jgi:hypothetical protein|nr:hypothetical protein [Acidimicrobiia bacterium]
MLQGAVISMCQIVVLPSAAERSRFAGELEVPMPIQSNPVARRVLCVLALSVLLLAGLVAGRASADQPHMVAAREHLRLAKAELDAAVPDKGGHRVRAIERVIEAIAEVDRGIEYERTH